MPEAALSQHTSQSEGDIQLALSPTGRLLYNPATPDSVFAAEFVRRYGKAAQPLLAAYTAASATQLQYATSIDFSWDFTIYGEG